MPNINTLLSILKASSKKLPQLKFAWGLLGISTVAALIITILGSSKAAILIMALTIVGMLIIFVASVAIDKAHVASQPAILLVWSVTLFFVIFLTFTISAIAISWPCNWVRFINILGSECSNHDGYECSFDNLLNYSNVPIAAYVPGQSQSSITPVSGGWSIDFSNNKNGTGIAFTFDRALDIRGCKKLELRGTSTQDVHFVIEYKIKLENNQQPGIVAKSPSKVFRSSSKAFPIQIPLTYYGTVNEITINFYTTGEASKVTIESIHIL